MLCFRVPAYLQGDHLDVGGQAVMGWLKIHSQNPPLDPGARVCWSEEIDARASASVGTAHTCAVGL